MKTFFTSRQFGLPKVLQKGFCLSLFMFILLLGSMFKGLAQTPLLSWDMSTQTSTAATGPLTPTIRHSYLAPDAGALTRGAGITPQGLDRGWGGYDWEQASSANLFGNKNLIFNVTPKPGFAISLSAINPFSYRRSNTGPSKAIIEATANSITSGISQGPVAFGNSTTSGADITPSVNLSADIFLQNVKGPITFNLSPYGATDNLGTLYIFDVANSTASDFSITGRILGSETLALSGFKSCFGFASNAQTFIVQGDGLTSSNVIVTAPTNYEISTDDINYSASISLATSGAVNQIFHVRLKSSASEGSYSGTVTITGGGFTPASNLGVDVSGTVNPTPTAGVLSGTQTVCENAMFNLSVAITGGTSPFTVVYNPNAVSVANYTSGANIPLMLASNETYSLVSVTDAKGCVVASPSGSAVVTVNKVRPGGISGGSTVCSNTDPSGFYGNGEPSSYDGTPSYLWQMSTSPDFSTALTPVGTVFNYDSGPFPNVTPTAVTYYFRRIITSTLNGVACTATSNTVTVTVNPEPVVSNQLATAVCSKSAIGVTINDDPDGPAITSYTISVVSTGLTGGGSNATLTGTHTDLGLIFADKWTNIGTAVANVVYTVTPSASGCVGTSFTVTVPINPEPVVSNQLVTAVCNVSYCYFS